MCAAHASAHAYQARAERTTCCIWNAQRPYQLRNTDASSLTFRETHSTLCQIGLLVGTISGTEALKPHYKLLMLA